MGKGQDNGGRAESSVGTLLTRRFSVRILGRTQTALLSLEHPQAIQQYGVEVLQRPDDLCYYLLILNLKQNESRIQIHIDDLRLCTTCHDGQDNIELIFVFCAKLYYMASASEQSRQPA